MAEQQTKSRPARKAPPVKYYRIGEVVEYSGVSRQTVHNYTVMGLIREQLWTQGGHRLYGEDVFSRLDEISTLRQRKHSLAEIRKTMLTAG
ncbi:MAG: MerR family transcriptional regulator [Phycisphaerales bacterium]|jgi:DNA-binding transcriptional MerR regulator|nr:MerR family transcriptional regulator [Phycisphaerales bacterium]MBT7171901.1 MerR family transcriptional regulator [Phycisphaerales bacterium]